MKVLLQNRYPHTWIGGDMIQLEALQSALRNLGIEADFSADLNPDLRQYDLIHLFHLFHSWSYFQSRSALRQNKPYLISSIYQDMEEFLSYHVQQKMVDEAAAIICNSAGELAMLDSHFTLSRSKTVVIPAGVDPAFLGEEVEPYRLPDDSQYVLSVGRINDKNQLRLATVCRDLGVPLVLVGEVVKPRYHKQLAAFGESTCYYLGPRSEQELIPIYKGAKVLACISPTEVFPSVVLEGGLAGCHIVLTQGSASMTDWPNVALCDPDNPKSIAAAIEKQMARPPNDLLIEEVKNYSWPQIAEQVAGLYERILSDARGRTWNGRERRSSESSFTELSAAQKRASIHAAYLLPAWKAYEQKMPSLGHSILQGYFDVGLKSQFLRECFTTSLGEYSGKRLQDVNQVGEAKDFIKYILSHLPDSFPTSTVIQTRIYSRLHLAIAVAALKSGDRLRALANGIKSIAYNPSLLLRRSLVIEIIGFLDSRMRAVAKDKL